MAKAAPIRAKCGLHKKRQRPNAPKALLVANLAEQGFSFFLLQEGYQLAGKTPNVYEKKPLPLTFLICTRYNAFPVHYGHMENH